MDNKEHLRVVIDSIIKGDDDAAKSAFAPYVQSKTRDILGYEDTRPVTTNESFTQKLKEFADLIQQGSPVQLRGDRVFVEGREVGVIQNDPTDFDSGINFIESGGSFSKEFDTLEQVYEFLIQRYTKRGNV